MNADVITRRMELLGSERHGQAARRASEWRIRESLRGFRRI